MTSPLAQVRRSRTISQAALAQLADVSQQDISKAERGLRVLPLHVQLRIAAILGMPRVDLFPSQDGEHGR